MKRLLPPSSSGHFVCFATDLRCKPTGHLLQILVALWFVFYGFLPEAFAAIAFVKNIGLASGATTGTTLSVAVPTAGVAAGTSIIVSLAMNPSAGTVSCTDTRSNSYAIDRDIINGSGTTGVRTVILSAHNVLSLTSGNTITCTHPSVTARAMSANQFSGIASTSARDQTAAATGNSTAPSSGATPTTTQASELLVGTVGVEGPSTETFTVGASYTIMGRRGTSGGTATNNITVNPEYRLVTATGAYSAGGTLSVAHRWAAAIVTYKAAPAPTKLVITSVNGGANPTAGTGFSVVVQAQTATGAPANVTAATAVSLSRVAGTGTLGGTLTGTIAAGTNQVTISGVTYTKAESGVILRATRTSGDALTAGDSAAFTVNPGAAAKLAFTTQPQSASEGSALAGPPQVAVQDSFGNTVTSSTAAITVAIGANPGGGVLGGTKTKNAASGLAAFTDLTIDKAGNGYTLTASSTGLTGATSAAFNINPLVPTKLAFIVQPGDTPIGSFISGAPTVAVQDSAGNTVTTANRAITITLVNNSNLGTLNGTKTKGTTGGVASFSNLTIDQPGSGYALRATSTGLTSATSSAFAITTTSNNPTLTINKVGSGTVTSSTGGINCGSTCSASFNEGTAVTLTATPAAGWTFSGWSGHLDCYNGSLTMFADKACTATFATTSPGFVQITSPAPDTVINASTVLVQGTVNVPAGIEVGVTINGVLAAVHSGTFAAIVPVASDTTSLTAVATTAIGTTASHSIPVSVSTTQGPSVTLEADPKNGLTPLITQFVVRSDFVPVNVELDIDSNGTIEYNGSQVENQRFFLTQAKFYIATARVTDPLGAVFTVNTVVQVYDQNELDTLLQSKWAGMKDALIAGDVPGALGQILADSRDEYASVFNSVGVRISEFGSDMPRIEPVYFEGDYAKYRLRRPEQFGEMTYYVYLSIDTDGIWRIQSF
jgi:hypothetical protein